MLQAGCWAGGGRHPGNGSQPSWPTGSRTGPLQPPSSFPPSLGGRKKVPLTQPPSCPVFVTLTCAFRYGREDLDVLGLSFRKDLFLASWQAFPAAEGSPEQVTRLQERLLRKLGANAHPFSFMVSRPVPTAPSAPRVGLLFVPGEQELLPVKTPPQHTFLSLPQIPQNLPCSVTLQPGPEDTGKVGLGEGEGRFWREEGCV